MRSLVFVLIFANLLFFAYSQEYFGSNASLEAQKDARRMDAQVNPEQMRVLARSSRPLDPATLETSGQADASNVNPNAFTPPATQGSTAQTNRPATPPTAPAAALTPPPSAASPAPVSESPALSCAIFSAAREEIGEQLSSQAEQAGFTVTRRGEGSWWVFIPPLPDRASAVKKASELSTLGVSDFFIINDPPQQFAISLGVFSRREGAESHLKQLQGKGVRSAKIGPRSTERTRAYFEIRGEAIKLLAFRLNLAEGLSSRDCPTSP